MTVNATTRRDPDLHIVGVIGVAQDVTESSKNDRAVAAMAHELRQLVVSMSVFLPIIIKMIVRILTLLSLKNKTEHSQCTDLRY